MLISVILSTYNQPAHLERVLWGYDLQEDTGFEIIIADDGSGPETRALLDRMRPLLRVPLQHVWQEDVGFRKNRILNAAILAAKGEYLVFSDGDCVPTPRFVGLHRRLARPGHLASGGYALLPAAATAQVTVDAVRRGDATRYRWLRAQGAPFNRQIVRFGLPPVAAWAADAITGARATFNGCNSAVWKSDAERVNGFEERMGYGREDHEFGDRLLRSGVRGIRVRYRNPVLHLYHERPYRADGSANQPILAEHRLRALVGLEQH